MTDFENKLFVINKHAGPTSFDVVRAFRRATRLRKVGHAGTLDPGAEGVLLLCTGRATRAVEHFMNLDKHYEFTITLGTETSTLDADGEVVREAPVPEIVDQRILDTAADFVGEYRLSPPAYSAIKRNGRRLYEMARSGEAPQVESRVVRIYDLEVTRIDLPVIGFRMRCSRGTYVRSLAKDFGERLGLPAHISHLVRTAIGHFNIEQSFPSQRIFDRDVEGLSGIAIGDALSFLPAIVLRAAAKRALLEGGLPGPSDVVRTIGAAQASNVLRILDEDGGLLAIGHRDRGAGDKPFAWVGSYRLFGEKESFLS